MLKLGHVDSFSIELHAFELEARPLFASWDSSELYLAAGSYDAMPRQLIDRVCAQESSNGSMV
ncbi:MAG TPA: hypothetical protein VL346_02890 [Acidobacteriaceae bacterium]|nr:hypothetical protein [Acidobacteriaceae bacterium]